MLTHDSPLGESRPDKLVLCVYSCCHAPSEEREQLTERDPHTRLTLLEHRNMKVIALLLSVLATCESLAIVTPAVRHTATAPLIRAGA